MLEEAKQCFSKPSRPKSALTAQAGGSSPQLIACLLELLGGTQLLGTFFVGYCAASTQHLGIADSDSLAGVEGSLISKAQDVEAIGLTHGGGAYRRTVRVT